LQDFTKRRRLQNKKLKILFQYGQRARPKTALDDFATGYLVNNGINEGPSGTKKIYYNIP
jgi:hypothetical protein